MPTLVKQRLYYDPLGRLVRTRNADYTEQRVIYGVPKALNTPGDYTPTPWENYSYDANDLAPLANPGTNPVPSTQWYTPKSVEIDALGRTIKTTEHQAQDTGSGYEDVNMFYSYDIRGNLLLVKDPYHRHVFEHKYDLRPAQKDEQGNTQPLPPIWTYHIDKGESTVLFDALGKPIESHDAKDAMALSSYDVISRPENAWAKNDSGDTLRLRQYLLYGDSAGLTNPQNQNLKGKLYQNYDEAGLNEISEYDFKGNVLNKKRQVVDSATLKTDLDNYNSFLIDWTGLPAILDTFVFETDAEYDALNRVTKLTLPEDVSATRKDIIPTYNLAGALEQVSYDGTDYVKNIAYNAKGQRLLIAFGNNVMTRYVYDNLSFRLLRQRSEKYTFSQTGSTVTYAYNSGTNKQDDGFNYDLVGNILKILNRVTDCGISGSSLGSNALDREFEYDPLYRLTYADGRESDTQNQNTYLYDDAPAPDSPNANHVRAYSRTYSYDKLGNVQSVVQGGTNGFTRDFVYNTGQNTLQEINDATPTLIEDFTYDDCGNQITAGSTRNYKWNHADQLYCYYNQASPADPTVFTQYDYDASGKRVSKLVRTGTLVSPIYERTIYIDGIFEYVKLENGTTYEKNYVHVMDDKSRICEVRVNVGPPFPGDITDDVTYHLEDQIGSSVVRLDYNGTEIDKEEYYPFGDSSLRTFTYKRYRYVGKERDQESGLYYYGARYYAAWTCRFISVDPLAKDYMYLTPYNYAGNRPIISVDIDGMQGDQNTTDSGGGGNTLYGPEPQLANNNTPSLPQINGVVAPWSNETIEKNSPYFQLDEVEVKAYPEFAYPVDDIDKIIANKGIENFAPKLILPIGITGGMQKEFAEWNYKNEVKSWNGLTLEEKWMEARQQIIFGALHEVAKEAMKPAYEGYKLYAEMGGWGSPTGAAGKVTKVIKESSKFDDTIKIIKTWLGADAKVITNKAGDKIFMSKDGLRKVRFDIKNPHGDSPHVHFEELLNGSWEDVIPGVHRVYPKPN